MPMTPSPTRTSEPMPARVVAVARDRVEAARRPRRAGAAASARSRTGRRCRSSAALDERVEIRAAAEALAQLRERAGGPDRLTSRRCGFGRDPIELDDAVDVGAPQLEDPLHAGERGDGFDVAVQPLEHRAAPLGALVAQHEPVLVVGDRVDEQHARGRVLGEVAHRLREELVRQRDALVVDEVHPGQVGHVRRAVGRRSRDHRRDDALEAALISRSETGPASAIDHAAGAEQRSSGRGSGRLVEQVSTETYERDQRTRRLRRSHAARSGVPSDSWITRKNPAM